MNKELIKLRDRLINDKQPDIGAVNFIAKAIAAINGAEKEGGE